MSFAYRLCLSLVFVAIVVVSTPTIAQELFVQNQLGASAPDAQDGDPASFSAEFKLKPGTQKGMLSIHAKLQPDWHIYSITQPKGGPMRSKIKVADSKDFKIIGDFQPDKKPHVADIEGFDVPAEEHKDAVTWSAPIEFSKGVDVEKGVVNITFNGQVCESKPAGSCKPLFGIKIAGKFAGFDENLKLAVAYDGSDIKTEAFKPGATHAEISGIVFHPEGKPIQAGDTVKLRLSAKPSGSYHVYAYEKGKCDYMATRIGFTNVSKCEIAGPKASTKPHLDDSLGIDMKYHHGAVTWTFDVTVPKEVSQKSLTVAGVLGLQTCDDEQCDPPSGATFTVDIPLGGAAGAALKFEQKTYGTAKKAQAAYFEAKEKDASKN